MTTTSKLFSPTRVGEMNLAHGVVLAPLTRFRADERHVHTDMAVEYYRQRASMPGTLLIAEATQIAPKAGSYDHVPGIWNDEQIAAWKKITDAVHAQGSFIYVQLWAVGRAANPAKLDAAGFPYVSSSATALPGRDRAPRALTVPEIQEYVELYAAAAANAIAAGFDGVELHGANGYLPEQFLQDVCNTRTDAYGGSIENRARFMLEIVDSIVDKIGATRTGVRLSPWTKFQGMGMSDPIPTFSYVVKELRERHPDLAFIHAVQPRIDGDSDGHATTTVPASNDFIRNLWAPRPLILAGGFCAASAMAAADEHGDLVAFGRYFISNPDLPVRIQKGIPFTPYNRATFYNAGSTDGYTDYPAAME